MKKLFYTLCLTLLGTSAFAQIQRPQPSQITNFVTPLPDAPVPMVGAPFPKANIIIILSPDSVAAAWTAIRQTLVQQGYGIAQSDKELASFTTVPKAPDRKTNIALTINGYVKAVPSGSAIYLFGNWGTAVSLGLYGGGNVEGEAVFAGMEGGGNKKAFRAVEAIAKAHSGGKVGYWLR